MLRQMTDTLGPFLPNAIGQAEAEIGAPLPEEYRQFLQRYNGGRPKPAWFRITWQGQSWARRFPYDSVHFLFGVQEGDDMDLLENFRSYRGRIPDDTAPIGCDPGGNLLLLGVSGPNAGKVLFWVRDYEVEEGETPDHSNVGFVTSSFNEFLDSLFER
jgi:hypothetical protein